MAVVLALLCGCGGGQGGGGGGVQADSTFGAGGFGQAAVGGTGALQDFVHAEHPDGSHIVAATRPGDRSVVVAFLPNGQRDTGFATDGTFTLNDPLVIEGLVVRGGLITLIVHKTDVNQLWLIRLHRDGTGDNTFGFVGILPLDLSPYEFHGASAWHVAGGRITLLCTVFHTGDAEFRRILLGLEHFDGSVDAGFGGGDGVLDVTEFQTLSMVVFPTAPARMRADADGKLLLLSVQPSGFDEFKLQSQRVFSQGTYDFSYAGGIAFSPDMLAPNGFRTGPIVGLPDGRVVALASAAVQLPGIFSRVLWSAWESDGAPVADPELGMFETELEASVRDVAARALADGRLQLALLGGANIEELTRVVTVPPTLDPTAASVHEFSTPGLEPELATWDAQGRLILIGGVDAITIARFLGP